MAHNIPEFWPEPIEGTSGIEIFGDVIGIEGGGQGANENPAGVMLLNSI